MVPGNSADQSAERSWNIQYPTASMRPPQAEIEHRPPVDNALPHFLAMMVRAPRAVDLLANSRQAAWAISVRNFERRVVAISAPPSHSVILTRFIAAAVATCCRWVFA